MGRLLPLQSAYRVFVSTPVKEASVDLTDYVEGIPSIDIDENRLAVLTFMLKDPEKHLSYLKVGYHISFYGGTIDSETFAERLQGANFSNVFKGSVRHIFVRPSPSTGKLSLEINAIDLVWSRTSYTNRFFAYPSKKCPRKFADKNVMSLEEIVVGICDDLKIDLEIDLHENPSYVDVAPAVQHNISDWAFLRKLANDNSCYLWTDPFTGTLYFVDKAKTINKSDRLEFVYLAREGNNFVQGEYLPDSDLVSEGTLLKPNQIPLLNISIEENPQMAGLHISRVTDYNEDTGESEERLTSYDETLNEIIYWELNQPLIDSMNKTDEGRAELDRIFKMGAFDIPREVFMKYYIAVPISKKGIKAIDRPFLGININATIPGNLNVLPFQSYAIHGISRYSSFSQKTGKYYLKGLTYKFGPTFTMDLRFRR